jgi:hypothetical protein
MRRHPIAPGSLQQRAWFALRLSDRSSRLAVGGTLFMGALWYT